MLTTIYQINRFNNLMLAALLTLSIGFLSGGVMGQLDARGMSRAIASACKVNCHKYSTAKQEYVGVLVAQDAKRTAIYSSDGLHIIKTDELQRVADYVPPETAGETLMAAFDPKLTLGGHAKAALLQH